VNGTTGSSNMCSVIATTNYQNGSTSMAVPDLSGVPGFLAPPATGTTVDWTAEILQGSGRVGQGSATANSNGSAVQTSGIYIVP
jgi:hypothetical protein